MLAIIIIFVSLLTISIYLNIRTIYKNFQQQKFLENSVQVLDYVSEIIKTADTRIREIDRSQHFESDDEVGFFFKELKNMQSLLNEFNKAYTNGEKEKQ